MNVRAAFRIMLAILVGFLFLYSGSPLPATANGNGSLNAAFQYTLHGDFVAAGIGLRGTGEGNIVLAGIPAGASIFRAYLYWATLGNSNTYTSPILNGQPVSGDRIGTSGDTCWGVQNNYVYRANVTSMVSGNGVYSVSGLPASLADGNDSQGASLVVLYEEAGSPLHTVVFNDGAVSLDLTQTSYTDTIGGYSLAQSVTSAQVVYLVGDGQATWDAGNITFNGTPVASGVFSGVDGPYWGTHRFDVTNLVSPAPVSTTIHDNDPNNPNSPDCLLWAATILSVPTQVQQTPGNNLSQFVKQEVIGDVTSAGVGLRGLGAGTIQLAGIPAGARVLNAYLYWATIGNAGTFITPQLNGQPIRGSLIGVSADTCWGAEANFVYRADVTGLVSQNGSYTISGLPRELSAGNDSQGASLVVIYQVTGFARTIIIDDGAVTLDLGTHSYTDTLGTFFANQPQAQAHITYLVGDGQEQWDTGNVTFEGTSIAHNVFTGVDGPYWGTLTFDVTGLVTEPESATTLNNNDPSNPSSPDCLLWAATVFSVETERNVVLSESLFLPIALKRSTGH